jgi:D-alanine transaminase
MNTVYLNGAYMPIGEARIPVLDRGFIFGDAVYEVIPVYGRRPFRLDDHLRRLRRSLTAIHLHLGIDDDKLKSLIAPIIEHAEWPDQGIYIQVTRGPAPRDLAIPAAIDPTLFIMAMPLSAPSRESIENGVSAITARDDRWQHCDIKTTSLLANVLLRHRSVETGCAETILIRDGWLTEGTSSNIFIVQNGVLLAPPDSPYVLPGITHDVVLHLASCNETRISLRPVHEDELRTADEIWITSSTREITPVVRLDGRPIGGGKPGMLFLQFHRDYTRFKQSNM